MSPDPEEVIRAKLRHFRRAEHELFLSEDLGGYFTEETQAARDRVQELVMRAAAELQRMRNAPA